VVLVGVGYLGQAIARRNDFRENGLQLVALFDADPAKVGTVINDMIVRSDHEIDTIVQQEHVKVAIVAVPATRAQEVVDRLVASGIRAILNYAPIVVQVPHGVWMRHIDPVSLLHSMTYYLAHEPLG